jgi:starch synthase
VRYSWRTRENKPENKISLQNALGLPARRDVSMLAIISRLVAHKGLDIIAEIAAHLVGGNDVQLVVLGRGDESFEHFFTELEHRFPDRVRALMRYDRDLAKQIYAAADIFLMPSKTEPCGLAQMISSRYGTIPVVRETGGLFDSIKGYWEEKGRAHGNGFTFAGYSSAELLNCTLAAITLWQDAERRSKLISRIMRTDFSWQQSAKRYCDMYSKLNG